MHVTCKDDKDKKMCFTEQNSDSTDNTETFTHGFFLHEDVMTTVMNSTQTVIIIIFIWLINIKKFLYSFLDVKLW